MVIRPLKPNEMTDLFELSKFVSKTLYGAFANFFKLSSRYNDGRLRRGMTCTVCAHAAQLGLPLLVAQRSPLTKAQCVGYGGYWASLSYDRSQYVSLPPANPPYPLQ